MKKDRCAMVFQCVLRLVFTFLLAISVVSTAAALSHQPALLEQASVEEPKITPLSNRLFQPYGEEAYALAQKIERGEPITMAEIEAVPQGVNARFGDEITFLFLTIAGRNTQAADKLLEAGADPYLVDRPSKGSARSFAYYLTLPGHRTSMTEGLPFINELIRLYLKHGGDPNYRISERNQYPLISKVGLIRNYEGMDLLLAAGADPWATDVRRHNLMRRLIMNDKSHHYINKLIDQGYFDEVDSELIQGFMFALATYPQQGDEISLENRKIGLRVLKRNPDYQADRHTERLFQGPIPWDEVEQAD